MTNKEITIRIVLSFLTAWLMIWALSRADAASRYTYTEYANYAKICTKLYQGTPITYDGTDTWVVVKRNDHGLNGWYALQATSTPEYDTETLIKLDASEWRVK